MFVGKVANPKRLSVVPFSMQVASFWKVHSAFESAVTFIVSASQPKDDDLDYVRINAKTFGERLSLRN